MGKLFPRSDRARDILQTLLAALSDAGVRVETGADVVSVERDGERWAATCADGRVHTAARLVLATGGRSLPKTGSRGFGFDAARGLGHTIAPVLPALTPLILDSDTPLLGLPGITHPTVLTLAARGLAWEQLAGARFRPLARSAGSLLITHRGASGPAALDVSGACALALHDARDVELVADFWALARPSVERSELFRGDKAPGASLPPDLAPGPVTLPEFLADVEELGSGDRSAVASVLARVMPRSLAERLLRSAGLDPTRASRLVGRTGWRDIHAAVARRDLRLAGVVGYAKAEATRGGVPLAELHKATLESRLRAELFFCGEVVSCTGRLGGFNFQWAWSSGFAAGSAARDEEVPYRPRRNGVPSR